MKLESDGILIDLRPMGERDSLAVVFTRDFGILRGGMRAAQIAKKNKPLIGQVGFCAWNARLDTQLGTFHWEAARNLAAPLMLNMRTLSYMNSAFALIATLLPEREQYCALYDETLTLLETLCSASPDVAYLAWELNFLRDLGYALDLSKCSACGCTDDLKYLSPRTGRAVCARCAAPYISRLYTLPLTTATTLRFIDGICAQQSVIVPAARMYLTKIQKN